MNKKTVNEFFLLLVISYIGNFTYGQILTYTIVVEKYLVDCLNSLAEFGQILGGPGT